MREIKMKVKGMVCSGCENRVKNALESLSGVDKVEADHKKDLVKVIATSSVRERDLEEKIDDLGFKFIEIMK